MWLNYCKTAWRILRKQKMISGICVFSLILGITSAFLILLYIQHELSYDRFNENADRIVRLTHRFVTPDGKISNHFARYPGAWTPIIESLRDENPEIETIARLTRRGGTVLRIDDERFVENFFFHTDQEIFKVFTIPLITGNRNTALANPFSVIITESMAKKYFNGDPIGQSLKVIGTQGEKSAMNYQVTGIMQDWPANSHLTIHFLASTTRQNLGNDWAYTYILLHKNASMQQLAARFPDFLQRHFSDREITYIPFHLQKLTDIHLHSHLDREIKANGAISTIYILAIVAIFIMVITCINYINLNTAQTLKRAGEIGIRRAIGSTRRHLVTQFLTESILVTVIAGALSLILIELALPELNQISGKNLTFQQSDGNILKYIIFVITVGLLSGIYPALFISRSGKISLPGSNKAFHSGTNLKNFSPKNLLVTLQFGISIFLLICMFILKGQLNFIHNKPLGFNKDQVICIGKDISQTTRSKYQAFRNRLIGNPNIVKICASMEEPSYEVKDMGYCSVESVREGEDHVFLYILPVDENFFDLMEIEILQGTNFLPVSTDYASMAFTHNENFLPEINETPRSYIINETALQHIGFGSAEEAIGKQMDWHNAILSLQRGPIVGVVEDFHFSTLHKKIKPFVLIHEPRFLGSVLVKLKPDNMPATIREIGKTWKQMFPDSPFEYHFLDDLFAELYTSEQQLNKVITNFSLIAILIACLGLFGLILHSTEQRTKEIGIRKVLGSSVSGILGLLIQDYIKWIVLANFIAWPIAYYFMRQWLQNFAYRIDITILPFLAAGFSALIIALLTVSWQAIRAATANPVESLRYE